MPSTDRWTEADVRAVLGERGCRVIQGLNPTPALPAQPPVALVYPVYRSKTEALYAQYLTALKHAGQIEDWRYEAVKVRLAESCVYTPDFLVVPITAMGYPRLELHEIKGWWREAAKIRFKVAREQCPWFRFRAIRRVKGQWQEEKI
jgi:hypothetical protein